MTPVVMSPNSSPVVSPRTALPFSPTQPLVPRSNPSNSRVSMPPAQHHAGGGDFRRRSTLDRPSTYARDRMSSYSVKSNTSSKPSRSVSAVFPFSSTLPYTQVRDFAYPINHPLHYGPPPDPSAPPSGQSTPALDASFVSPDHPQTPLALRTNWSEAPADGTGQQLAAVAYGDVIEDHGPPYSEDEDLQSPVVISSHSTRIYDDGRGYFAGTNGDGSENYYLTDPVEEAGGPGGVLETYSSEQARQGTSSGNHSRHISHTLDPSNTHYATDESFDGQNLGVGAYDLSSHRLSRDYSFTITSPDEEMHGKAVALFDFQPENDNELPLAEGQVIWVSYRNGQGWLVAEDPKTRETGLVPEEYVRLFRHIESEGWRNLTGENGDVTEHFAGMALSPIAEPGEMTSEQQFQRKPSLTGNGAAVQSTFSTSSKDLEPYPHPLPTGGHGPPQITHQKSDPQSIAEVLSPKSTGPELQPAKEPDRRKSSESARSKENVSRKDSKNGKRTSKSSKR